MGNESRLSDERVAAVLRYIVDGTAYWTSEGPLRIGYVEGRIGERGQHDEIAMRDLAAHVLAALAAKDEIASLTRDRDEWRQEALDADRDCRKRAATIAALRSERNDLREDLARLRARDEQTTAVVEAARDYRDYLAGDLVPHGGELRRERLFRALTALDATPEHARGSEGACLIAVERRRQVEAEGWSAKHDDEHDRGDLAIVAAMLAVHHTDGEACAPRDIWDMLDNPRDPWGLIAKHGHDQVRTLSIAGALIAAEIDRLIRAARPDQRSDATIRVVESDEAKAAVSDYWLGLARSGPEDERSDAAASEGEEVERG